MKPEITFLLENAAWPALLVDAASTILRAITIQGSHVGSVAELIAVVALARERKIKPIPIQTRPLAEVSRTLDELKAGSVIGRVAAQV